MKIVITGSNSFVGKLFRVILSSDHELILLSSTSISKIIIQWQLTDPFPDHCKDADLFIHLAYDYSHSNFLNVIKLIENIEILNNEKAFHVFFSSYSARVGTKSKYGNNKLLLEKFFLNKKSTIVRPGLIVGTQGLYEKMRSLASNLFIIPIPFKDTKSIPICRENDLIILILNIISSITFNILPPKEINLYDTNLVSIKELFQEVMQLRRIYIKFPYILIYFVILLSEKIGLKLPVTSDNFRGYFANQ